MNIELYKLDDKHEIMMNTSDNDSCDAPHFFILKYEPYMDNYEREVKWKSIYIRLDEPEYYLSSYPWRLSRDIIEKLAKAMDSDVEIRDGDFYLKANLWNLCVYLWNIGNCEDEKLPNDKTLMPNYLELLCVEGNEIQ